MYRGVSMRKAIIVGCFVVLACKDAGAMGYSCMAPANDSDFEIHYLHEKVSNDFESRLVFLKKIVESLAILWSVRKQIMRQGGIRDSVPIVDSNEYEERRARVMASDYSEQTLGELFNQDEQYFIDLEAGINADIERMKAQLHRETGTIS